MDKKSILIFGLGFLQQSLIEQCKKLGLYTIGIDPCENPFCKDEVDVFEVVGGQDFESTLSVAKKYNVAGVVTVATDKPLGMMAKVANELGLPFYSEETAAWSTDKLQMKGRFMQYGVPCAKGLVVTSVADLETIQWEYPVIVKPRDNSGSRGVIYCQNREEAVAAMVEALQYTKMGNVLVEEYVDGQEYSIEGLHYAGKTYVIQYTQKKTTEFPYNVEIGHIQPAPLAPDIKDQIKGIIVKVAEALNFDNCGSHTELKINANGKITVIETSPRLGGDFITSKLTPLSTGVNVEQLIVKMSIGELLNDAVFVQKEHRFSAVTFFCLPEGEVVSIEGIEALNDIEDVKGYSLELEVGDKVNKITSSLDRYGWAIVDVPTKEDLKKNLELVDEIVKRSIIIQKG